MEKRLYIVCETSNRKHEIYYLFMAESEIREWCRVKNEVYGGKRCDGGDPSYGCWACLCTPGSVI